MDWITLGGLFVSVGLNVYLLFIKKPEKKQIHSMELTEFIHDMTERGSALLLVERVDPRTVIKHNPDRI